MKNYCVTCKKTDVPLMKNARNKYKNKIHQYYICRECNSKKSREYRKTDEGKKAFHDIQKRQYLKNRKKILARMKVYCAVKAGAISKPLVCSVCGLTKSLQAHHPNYENPLVVVWLCKHCHDNVHKNLL